MAARYPEVAQELRQIEESLEAIARAAAVAPRPGLRNQVLARIAPSPSSQANTPATETPVRPLQPASAARTGSHWLIAASIGLALLSSLAALYFWNRWQETEERLASMQAQNSVLAQNVRTLENSSARLQQSLAVLTDPGYRTVPMKGLSPAPNARAVVYWNPSTATVYLNAGSLPKAPAGKQYQLWAIVDGKPVDAGVFD
ncbi:anti-sigma factor, partial [Cesiribacter andamanensis]|uniref:anti-sigma factor n=1 Tax=Cesiribacter andamanensis TaxID=649507 RepID=UPI0013770FC8